MTEEEFKGRLSRYNDELDKINENIKNIENGINNNFFDNRTEHDIAFYKAQKEEYIEKINGLYWEYNANKNEDLIKNKIDVYKQKTFELNKNKIDATLCDRFYNQIKIDYNKICDMLKRINFSKDMKIDYDNEFGYIYFKDPRMEIDSLKYNSSVEIENDYINGRLLLSNDDFDKVENYYNNVAGAKVMFNRKGSMDYVEYCNRLYFRTNAVLFINDDHIGFENKIYKNIFLEKRKYEHSKI